MHHTIKVTCNVPYPKGLISSENFKEITKI